MLRFFPIVALALAGCVTPEQQLAEDAAMCSGYGFQTGTTAYASCMMQIDQIRRVQRAEAMASLGRSMQQASNPPRLQTTCTTTGNITNCY